MEIIVTVAYFFLVRFIFVDYKILKWNLAWGIIVFGIYSGAALTEIVFLGQYAPYSEQVFVERRVVQVATYMGGQVETVHVKANTPIKKGDPLYTLDKTPVQDKLDAAKALLAEAKTALDNTKALVDRKVMAATELPLKQDAYNEALANVNTYKYELQQVTAYAPSDGYVVNLQLHEGQFVRLKAPVMTFVSTDEAWLVMKVRQAGSQNIAPNQDVEFALTMYPGHVFKAKVDSLVKGVGEAQFDISGKIAPVESVRGIGHFAVVVNLDEEELGKEMVFGAGGIAAINTGEGAPVFWLLRRIEIQSESLLNYVYNPFKS
ncbi:HlyD family secretion protein [Colwellia echini]|uniref:Biotin/lipoyl-binding protein n=1 Tax=Colwellia echini TaxID=1982103 RepID=A0ABY3MTV8_9GAMM|nr:efflux RND transporter periplasmic adaptor subunit [Colwellia echini]TYK64637.1 biotin/lipoyl-binding protein [Colwellia echini]